MTALTDDVLGSTRGWLASTSTRVWMLPTVRTACRLVVVPTVTEPFRAAEVKPSFSIETSYAPGERLGKMKCPPPSVVCCFEIPVAEFRTVTVAAATVPPVLSVTVPSMRPVLDDACGQDILGESRIRLQTRPNKSRFMVLSRFRGLRSFWKTRNNELNTGRSGLDLPWRGRSVGNL